MVKKPKSGKTNTGRFYGCIRQTELAHLEYQTGIMSTAIFSGVIGMQLALTTIKAIYEFWGMGIWAFGTMKHFVLRGYLSSRIGRWTTHRGEEWGIFPKKNENQEGAICVNQAFLLCLDHYTHTHLVIFVVGITKNTSPPTNRDNRGDRDNTENIDSRFFTFLTEILLRFPVSS